MAVNHNTTSLSANPKRYQRNEYEGGTLGSRYFNTSIARQASVAISRDNYRKTSNSGEIRDFREIIYRMVESWSTEDKLIIINNYGDASQLQQYKKVTPEIINAVCTESIIIHMDPADLRQLKADMVRKKEKLKSDIKTLTNPPNGKYKSIKKHFNTETFEELYQQLKNAKTPEEYTDFRKKFDPSYTIPRSLRRNYQTLRSELNEVLKSCFNKLELTTIAFQMGIEINQTMKQKDIILAIINKTCLFVDLIIGKGKANYGNAFMFIDPFKQVLKYTSYAYVLGDPSIDPNQWIELKRNAQRAKRTIVERSRIQNTRKNITRRFNKTFNSITGGMRSSTTLGLAHQIRMNDRGILQNVSTEELLELAGRYGIDISKEHRVNVIKAKLYSAIYFETRRVNKLRRNERLLEAIGRGTNRYISDLLSAHSGMPSIRRPENIATKIKEEKLLEEYNRYGYNIPTVEFLQSGIRKTPNILAAVPVYVIGYGHAGGLNKTESEKLSSSYETRSKKSLKSPFSVLSVKSSKKEKTVLNKNDEELLNIILSMPYNISAGSIGHSDHINSLSKMADNILIPNALKMFEQIILDVYTIAGKGKDIDFSKLTDPSSRVNISNAMLLLKPDSNPDILNSIRIRYAYAYAAYRKRYSLCNYITENYGISYDTRRLKFESGFSGIIKKIPKFIKNIFTLPENIVERVFSNIKTKTTAVKNPTNKADLSESARAFYDELNSVSSDSSSLVVLKDRLIAKKKINIKLINYYTVALTTSNNTSLGSNPENSKNIAILFLKAAISYAEGQVQCYNLFKYEIQQSVMYSGLSATDASSLISEIFSDLSILFSSAYGKVFRPFKKITDSVRIGAKGLGEIFRSRGKSELGYSISATPKDDIAEGVAVVPESLRATHSSILKIEKLLSSTNDILIKLNNGVTEKFDGILAKEDIKIETLKAIYETLKTISSSSSTIPASPSISAPVKDIVSKKSSLGKLKDLVDAYNKHFSLSGDEIMDSSGRVLLTNKANAQEAMISNGMKMTLNSDPISSLDLSKRNIFKATRKAIDWAIRNDKRFATGGITSSNKFITGDASGSNIFANGAKPELVETFSNAPTISKITPIKKYQINEKIYELGKLTGTIKKVDFLSKEAKNKAKVTKLFKGAATPVYLTNDLGLKDNNRRILKVIGSLGSLLNSHLADLKLGLSNEVVAAPMGVGAITRPTLLATGIQDKVLDLLSTAAELTISPLKDIFEANTGGTIRTGKSAKFGRLPTGGVISNKNSVSAITGDASGSNIFANGAKPELVTSSTDLQVTPLNKESKANRNKTERMNLSDRKNALATGITSHIIKYNYKLPDNAEDVSNVGEAIKVFNVKPGISDLINLNGTDVSLIQLLSQIYAQLITLNSAKQTDEALLTAIAANSGKTTNTIAANPFTGSFTNSLNTILGGD